MIAAVLDHLWQSTLFAAAAGLVTLLLAGNAARVRFWVWFAASVKFLLPFAWITALGALLLPPRGTPLPAMLDGWAPAAQPFLMPAANAQAITVVAPAAVNWTLVLLLVWGLGTLAIALRWLSRWMTLREMLAQAGAVSSIGGILVRRVPAGLEPGLFGIWRPVILLPEDIDTRLSSAELEAVLAHEACHRDHRDNLLAAVHMLVEALFWFHPLVWWLGARLNHERERACDEAVLAAGQAPEIYAESILKVCKLYVHSPLACVAGVSGSDLKARIERIVMSGVALPLGVARKLMLAGFAGASLIVPLMAGLLMTPLVVGAASQGQSRPEAYPTPERMAQLRVEQAMPRKQVPFDPKDFDKFTGVYEFGPTAFMTVSRDGSRFFTRLTGQTLIEVFPESQTKFFTTTIPMPAQISFDSDAGGSVTGLVLHQYGREQLAPRLNPKVAKLLEDTLATRIRNNKPSSGTEASLRRYIDSLEKGTPNYDEMMPALANNVRMQLPSTLDFIRQVGPLKSLNFMAVNSNGMDVYDVVFEHGRAMWFIAPLTIDGKVVARGFQRLN
jgi:beta-lactamase regulating signal transducer with metallopeptidase domain